LEPMFPIKEIEGEGTLTLISVAAGLLGIGLSYYMYVVNTELPGKIANSLGGFYRLVYDKYRVDEVYDAAVVRPVVDGSTTVLWHGVDQGVIDGIVNGVGHESKGIGDILKRLQSGNIRSYATWIAVGAVALLIAFGLGGGIR
ncbi:MAG: NADH-quinone oxidoreductase subunit L, partial [Acidobacteriota bacterium]